MGSLVNFSFLADAAAATEVIHAPVIEQARPHHVEVPRLDADVPSTVSTPAQAESLEISTRGAVNDEAGDEDEDQT